MNITTLRPDTLDRMERAVSSVKERVITAAAALEGAGLAYAVAGGNAVAAWVSQVDPDAVRATRDVDILVRRDDLPAVKGALEGAGFLHHMLTGVDVFIEGEAGRPSAGVHLLYAGEKVRAEYVVPNPDLTETVPHESFRIVPLEGLVRMKLASWRKKDQVHLQDMVRVGLVDSTWPDRYPVVLAARLREIIADPDG